MRLGRASALVIALCAACSSGGDPAESQQTPPQRDARPPEPPVAARDEPPAQGLDETDEAEPVPTGGDVHFDSARSDYTPRARRVARAEESTLELLLRSTPPGALAAIDGKALGTTPVLWRGQATGRPHEFTFVLPGFAMARYRFTPVRSGIVHGTLKRLSSRPADAGPEPSAPADTAGADAPR